MLNPIVHVDRIDAGWVTEALTESGVLEHGARVVQVHREPCGTGQLADSYRFTLTYDRPGAGPATLVGKFPSDDAASRTFGKQSGYYKQEVLFYEQVAPRLSDSVAIPSPVHVALDANETDFVLLMADLAPARAVDQLHGCTADEAAAVVEQMAALHAGTWHDPRLTGQAWLKGTATSFAHVTDNFPQTVAGFREIAGDLVPDDQIAEAARLNDHLDTWKAVFSRPRCLWHSDLRADNLLFDACAGAMPVAILDWQGVGYGLGTIDLPYFLGTSLRTEVRRDRERDIVATYHRALLAHGVRDYGAEQCWRDYRLGALHGLQVGLFGLGAVKRSERGDRMWQNWIDRTCAQVSDLDSYTALVTDAAGG